MSKENMKPFIKITGIQLAGHSIPVPAGLDEVLNNGNGWGKKDNSNDGYKREVVKRDGRLFTILTKEGGETK